MLQVFSAEHPVLTVSEAAALTGLTRATARRLLLTFTRLGFASTDGKGFRLTARVLRLGYGYLSSQPLGETAQPHMRALADELREACSMATLDGDEIVYVARVPSMRSMSITLNIGSRLPAYPTSMGRVLLAALPSDELDRYLAAVPLERLTPHTVTDVRRLSAILGEVREQGYAVVDGEREEGVRSAAVPVRSSDDTVLAALNVSANAARMTVEQMHTVCVPRLLETAERIAHDIRFR